MIPTIIDNENGILLQFDLENGLALGVLMDDEVAQEFVNIIQNKLNARFSQ